VSLLCLIFKFLQLSQVVIPPPFLTHDFFPLLIPKTPNSIAVLIDQCMIVIEKRISTSRSQTRHTAVSLLSLSLESDLNPELLVVLVEPSPVFSL
jgi:hypothetical protein